MRKKNLYVAVLIFVMTALSLCTWGCSKKNDKETETNAESISGESDDGSASKKDDTDKEKIGAGYGDMTAEDLIKNYTEKEALDAKDYIELVNTYRYAKIMDDLTLENDLTMQAFSLLNEKKIS